MTKQPIAVGDVYENWTLRGHCCHGVYVAVAGKDGEPVLMDTYWFGDLASVRLSYDLGKRLFVSEVDEHFRYCGQVTDWVKTDARTWDTYPTHDRLYLPPGGNSAVYYVKQGKFPSVVLQREQLTFEIDKLRGEIRSKQGEIEEKQDALRALADKEN